MIAEKNYLKAKQIVQEYEKQLHLSDVGSSFFCSEWEWNEGRPRCDEQCKDCKKTQKLLEKK